MALDLDKTRNHPKDVTDPILEQTDRLVLFCSDEARQLVAKYGKMFREDPSIVTRTLPTVVVEFQNLARRDLGTDRRTH
jgi:hypothetical protein